MLVSSGTLLCQQMKLEKLQVFRAAIQTRLQTHCLSATFALWMPQFFLLT